MADNVNVTEGSGKTVAGDDIGGVIHQRVKITVGADGSNDGDVSSANPMPVSVASASGTIGVYISGTAGTLQVQNTTSGTVSIGAKDGTFAVYFSPSNPKVNLGTDSITGVDRVRNVVDGTLTTVTGVDRVRNLIDGTISTVTSLGTVTRVDRVMNLIDGTLSTVTGVDRVRNVVDGTLTLVTTVNRVNNLIDGTVRVGNITGSTLQVNVGTIAGTAAVYLHSTSGTVNVQLKPGAILTNSGHTAEIFIVSGSTSGGTTSGVTLIAPSASYNFKVFAYSLQTTAIVANVWRFCNGSGASQTEFWRPLVISSETTSTPKGANFGVQPPGFIFATGTSTTLVLHSDAGSLVHYSVSYIKESA